VRSTLAISQDELAGWTGISQSGQQRAAGLHRRSWIETGRNTILVRDPDALRTRAA
jgi:hypothetical protein